jgi:poly-gamma-glutamate synthesis protein (capsule biosynthesis protein)
MHTRTRAAAALSAAPVCLVVLVGLVALAGCDAGDQAPPPPTAATVTLPADVAVTKAPAPPPPPSPTPTREPFASSVAPIDEALAQRMHASWRAGCPVPLEDLRYVTVTYVDFAGAAHTGELVVHADVAEGIVGVFARLYEIGYPVASMRLVDDFGADDDASMAADNTSAFNCRAITGGTAWSEHAYGRAIDLNPVENPYVRGSHVAPDAGAAFVARTPAPGVILPDDEVVRAFAAAGWQWGGYWEYPIDYQHFSTTGR